MRVGQRGRDVQARVLPEEAKGLQHEADVVHGHHGPILNPRNVMETERVPNDDVFVLDRAVLSIQSGSPPGFGFWFG
jgi:hypothetical protein